MNTHKFGLLLLIVFCCCVVGCSNGNITVKGQATYEDGTPLNGGIITFESEVGAGRGNIDKNGYFVAGYVKERDGLPPGTYKVAMPMISFGPPVVAANQMSPQSTDITITVEKGKKNYDLVFKKPGSGEGDTSGSPGRPPRP